ncbi:hypothetical protein AB0067_27755, partial [Klebsiella pneumoniae]
MTQSGAAMDRRIERPHAKRWRVIVRSAIGVVVVIAALVLWLLMPGSNTLSVDSAAIRTGAVT